MFGEGLSYGGCVPFGLLLARGPPGEVDEHRLGRGVVGDAKVHQRLLGCCWSARIAECLARLYARAAAWSSSRLPLGRARAVSQRTSLKVSTCAWAAAPSCLVPGICRVGSGDGSVQRLLPDEGLTDAIDGQVGGELGAAVPQRLPLGIGAVGGGEAVADHVTGLGADALARLNAERAENVEELLLGPYGCQHCVRLVAQPLARGDAPAPTLGFGLLGYGRAEESSRASVSASKRHAPSGRAVPGTAA